MKITNNGHLEVRAPIDLSSKAIEALLLSEASGLAQALTAARGNCQPIHPPVMTGRMLPLLDERLCLVVRAAGSPRIYRNGQELWLHSPSAATEKLTSVLESWYQQQAWLFLPPRLRQLAEQLGVRPTRVTVRSQKTRWGSCSIRGTISLNWRLMLLPSVLADYVLAHELCHLRHLDHSSHFWALLSTLVPDYRKHRSALRQVSASLPW
ncbi:MAG: SprT family zinc-dependent metalloprotease [Gammaproteobacteria bacterium]|jgi:predicted metal-dependent hydrolase